MAAPLPIQAAEQNGRYTMIPRDEGVLRLDTRTGAISHCGRTKEEWVCREIADDRLALQSEIDRLGQENTSLKRELERLQARPAARPPEGDDMPDGKPDLPGLGPEAPLGPPAHGEASPEMEPDGNHGDGQGALPYGPHEKDMDQLAEFFERMVRRLHEMMEALRKESLESEPQGKESL